MTVVTEPRPRPLRAITPIERNVLLLLRTLRHGSPQFATDLASVLSVAIAPFRELVAYDQKHKLAIQLPGAAFVGTGETALLLAIAAFQRPATIELQLPDDQLCATLKSCASGLRASRKRLSWRPHLQGHLEMRGWIVTPARSLGVTLARRRQAAATKSPPPLREGSLRRKLVELLLERETITTRELRAAGVSRQYLSLLAADGLVRRRRSGVYAIGPRAQDFLAIMGSVTPLPSDAEDCDRHRLAE